MEPSEPKLTAHALAQLLLAGPDVLVLIPGYEGGFNIIQRLSRGQVSLDDRGWYYGEWRIARGVDGGEPVEAVALMPDTERLSASAELGLDD